jgi:hypothetical protein
MRSGRLEKRTRLAIPVQISSLQDRAYDDRKRMFSGSARFGATAQRAGWTAGGQVSKWRSASPRSRSLLPASFRWAFWCWFTIPTKGQQLARKFARWWLRLSSGYGNLRASTAADSRKIIHTLPRRVKPALQTLPIQETPACYGRPFRLSGGVRQL